MPNTGRFYAPTTAAAYRDRFMRPYSTVSAPVGSHAVAVPSPKLPATASYQNRPVFRRVEEEAYASPSSPPVYENRVRGRPVNAEFDRQVGDERRYVGQSAFQEKQPIRQRAWAQEIASRVSSAADVRSIDSARREPINPPRYITSMEDVKSVMYEPTGVTPSTLPRLSSLLNRSSCAEQFIDDERLTIRKRTRDFSPRRGDPEPPAKFNRRFYDEGVADERANYVDNLREKTKFSGMPRHESPMAIKNPANLVRSHLNARRPVVSPQSSRDYEQSPRYSVVREDEDERQAPSNMQTQVRRVRDVYSSEPSFRSGYEGQGRGYESQRRSYYIPDAQRTLPVGMFRREVSSDIDSPRPTTLSRDAFSPVSRYSDSKEGERVIEAAADLVEERSPSKRESITKLLLKSKEFLKAKSLVRNRNNEIDWVATFLNVGFECNSIYSLMCPLRKGRWKVEEEKYTMELLRLIENGTIRLRHGQSIRGFIAKKLHSDDMRVLKKLSNCKMFHFARLINPRMSEEEEIDESMPNVRSSLDRLDKLKAEFLRSVQLEALVAVRKYLSDTSIRDLLNARD